MLVYNTIMGFINSKCNVVTDDEEVQQILLKLDMIKYLASKLEKVGWKIHPHRCLLILDDFASHPLVRSRETDMSRLLKKLRHFNINVMICVQTCKSMTEDFKHICTDFILFHSISEDDFNDLLKESMACKFERKALWKTYNSLTCIHYQMRIHIYANKAVLIKDAPKQD